MGGTDGMDKKARTIQNEFIRTCRDAAARGLLACSSGNLSRRLDGGRMLVTRTRSWLGDVGPEDVAVCSLADGASLNGVRPTVEVRFHAGILRARPELNVVLHFQSPCATTLACRSLARVNFDVIPEIPFYIGPIARVPFRLPGSPALADVVVRAMTAHNLAILANHGQVTAAVDFAHAIQNAVFFELACRIILDSGARLRPLPAAAVRRLRNGTV